MIWMLLVALTAASARPVDEGAEGKEADGDWGKVCRVGNLTLPVDIFESYVGWECYEDTYRGGRRLTVYVCLERYRGADFSVPCFKSGSRMMSFNLKNEESVREIRNRYDSQELNDEMIRCYLSVVSACETSADGWLGYDSALGGHPGCRFFLTNNTREQCLLEGQSKFHITLLCVSMIVGIPIALIFFYCSWVTQNVALSHCRNLIVALVLRTFFSLLIETEVVGKILEAPGEPLVSWSGCEALASFENITSNLVFAFWLILTFYLLECSKNRFEKEPDIRLGVYIVLGFALTMAVIWMIAMGAGGYGNCWLERTPMQWLNDALRLGFVLIQLGLIFVVVFRIITDLWEVEESPAPLLRKMSIFTMGLTPLFLLQFSMTASHPTGPGEGDAHIYAEYFFDGFQGALVSLLYLFLPEVTKFILDTLGLESRKQCDRVFDTGVHVERELRLPGHRSPTPRQTSPVGSDDELRKDITYTSVLTAERFEKTIRLYNRLNVIPREEPQTGTVHPEPPSRCDPDNSSIKSEYYDVDDDSIRTVYDDVSDPATQTRIEVQETVTKAPQPHRYYSSRYLLRDSDSSLSEESVIEVKSKAVDRPVDVAPATESPGSSVELSPPVVDKQRAIETWLESCRSEFEDYAERAIRKRSPTTEGYALHRSLSGGFLTGNEIPGCVRVSLKSAEAVGRRKGSAPSLTMTQSIPEPGEATPASPTESLPSIYDDLKHYPKRSGPRLNRYNRKRGYNADWSNYRDRLLANKRRIKSLEAFEGPQKEQLSSQLNALLSPRYEPSEFHAGGLETNLFARFRGEDLSAVGYGSETGASDVISGEKEERESVVDDWEPQKMHFVEQRQY